MSIRDGAVRLIFAGWLPQDGLFGRSASAGLSIEHGFGVLIPLLLIVVTQVAPRAAASSSSWSGCWGSGGREPLMVRNGAGVKEVVPRSRRSLPVRGRCQRGARAAQRA